VKTKVKVALAIIYVVWATISINQMLREPVTISGTIVGKMITGRDKNYPKFSLTPDMYHSKGAYNTIDVSWQSYHTYRVGDKYRTNVRYDRAYHNGYTLNIMAFIIGSTILFFLLIEHKLKLLYNNLC